VRGTAASNTPICRNRCAQASSRRTMQFATCKRLQWITRCYRVRFGSAASIACRSLHGRQGAPCNLCCGCSGRNSDRQCCTRRSGQLVLRALRSKDPENPVFGRKWDQRPLPLTISDSAVTGHRYLRRCRDYGGGGQSLSTQFQFVSRQPTVIIRISMSWDGICIKASFTW
jgi:hypothetical protein